MDEKQKEIIKEALREVESDGFDRGVKTILVELIREMDENNITSISYKSIKDLHEQYSLTVEKP